MRKVSLHAQERNNKREVYTWIKKDKFEELLKISEESDVPVATIARTAILEMLEKIKRRKRLGLSLDFKQ